MILKAFPLLAEALAKSENKDILDFNNPQKLASCSNYAKI